VYGVVLIHWRTLETEPLRNLDYMLTIRISTSCECVWTPFVYRVQMSVSWEPNDLLKLLLVNRNLASTMIDEKLERLCILDYKHMVPAQKEFTFSFVSIILKSPSIIVGRPFPPHILDIAKGNDDRINHVLTVGMNLQVRMALWLQNTVTAVAGMKPRHLCFRAVLEFELKFKYF
jgi:hypothetical protein